MIPKYHFCSRNLQTSRWEPCLFKEPQTFSKESFPYIVHIISADVVFQYDSNPPSETPPCVCEWRCPENHMLLHHTWSVKTSAHVKLHHEANVNHVLEVLHASMFEFTYALLKYICMYTCVYLVICPRNYCVNAWSQHIPTFGAPYHEEAMATGVKCQIPYFIRKISHTLQRT